MPLKFFLQATQASDRKMGYRCNSFCFCYWTALAHDALILAARSMQGPKNRRTTQHFRFVLFNGFGGLCCYPPLYIRALFNSCRLLPAFQKFLCLLAEIDPLMMPWFLRHVWHIHTCRLMKLILQFLMQKVAPALYIYNNAFPWPAPFAIWCFSMHSQYSSSTSSHLEPERAFWRLLSLDRRTW